MADEPSPPRDTHVIDVLLWIVFAAWIGASFWWSGERISFFALLGCLVMPYLIARQRRIRYPWLYSVIGGAVCLLIATITGQQT
jgi:hypothetical protein